MKQHSRLIAFSIALLVVGGLLVAFLPRPIATAQGKESNDELKPEVYSAVGFGVTPAIRDMKPDSAKNDSGVIEGSDEPIRTVKNPVLPKKGDALTNVIDPLLSLTKSAQIEPHVLPPPMLSFDGTSNADNLAAFGFRLSPPDTNGDVGPTQYFQTVNLLFRVFTKAGVPVTPPTKMSSIFAAAGVTGVCATNDNGDPIVLYDQLADRWMISQFAFASSTAPPYHQCIAVSKTGDATGAYFAYDFITPGANLNDYPHFGVWPDAYYMTDNQFLNGGSFNGAGAFAFDRAKMLRGDPTATFIYFNQPPPRGGQLPSDMDGLIPPPPGTPNYFCEYTAALFGDPEGNAVKIFEFHVDFATPANSTFTLQQNLPVAVFDPRSPGGRNIVEQPPPSVSTTSLDVIQDRLMYRVQYRNFGTRDALVLNHTVNVSGVNPTTQATHQAGIRYYDLRRPTPGSGLFAVGDQGTFSPDAGNGATGTNRWMGSVAQDNQGNLALGYSTSSTTVFPSVNYTGRLFGDPAGTLQTPEQTIVAGSGVQRSTGGRWGDYSMLGVDPRNDCDFWFTSEYYTAASQASSTVGWLTRIGSFKFAGCTAPAQGTLNVTVTNCETSTPVQGASVTINGNLYGATIANGTFSTNLPPGTYTVVITGPSFTTASQTVTITDGGTVSVNVCLTGIAVINAAGSTLVNESCPPPNSAVDPGETATLNLKLMNNGTASTINLVATLQPSANVLAPSGPQTYGALAPGAMAGRDFTFTANGNCGDQITLTLQLQDGAMNLGTVTYTLRLGAMTTVTALSENFDGVTPPALPAGWTTDVTGIGIAWTTSTINPDTAPNDAFGPETPNVGVTNLNTPVIAIPAGSPPQLRFRNLYNVESGFDGEVLEININGGGYQDILTAGGSFVSGGYNGTLNTGFANPLPGRMAWTGLSGGTTAAPTYITSTVNLPAAAAGQNIQLRWRVGSDDSVVAAGQNGVRIDTITLSTTSFVCNTACAGAPRIGTSTVLSCNGGNTVATITISNSGTATANGVMLTTARLGGVNGTPLPQSVGTLAPGASSVKTVTFSGAPSGMTTLQVGGTFSGGTFNSSRKVTAPACNAAMLRPATPYFPSLPALLAVVAPITVLTGR